MKLAEKIAKKMKNNEESSANAMGAMDKKAMGMVEKLCNEEYGKDCKMQEKMCHEMLKLAEMDCKVANEFMEYMDEMASKYEMQDMEEAKKKNEEDDEKEKEKEADEEKEDEEDVEEEEEEEESDEMKHKKKEAKK